MKLLILKTVFATFALVANTAVFAAPDDAEGTNFEPSHTNAYPLWAPVISTSANTLILICDTLANTLALVKYKLLEVSITLDVYKLFHTLAVILPVTISYATILLDNTVVPVILPANTVAVTSIFLIIILFATNVFAVIFPVAFKADTFATAFSSITSFQPVP